MLIKIVYHDKFDSIEFTVDTKDQLRSLSPTMIQLENTTITFPYGYEVKITQ